MIEPKPRTILCLASYEKGFDFMHECKQQGCRVLLLTQSAIVNAPWPRDVIDGFYDIPDMYKRQDMIYTVSYLARTETIDRIVPLDDFDVETAAALREHLRLPGMGESQARFFRDKLAMRMEADQAGIRVPPFVAIFNYDRVRDYLATVPGPWVLKPRSEASSVGIKRIAQAHELWPILETLGDRQSFYLLEKYIPGDVFHVDSIVAHGQVVFAETHRYAYPLLDITQHGGMFCSRTLERGCDDERTLRDLNGKVLATMGLDHGVSHTEFIKGPDGQFHFLETSARVGGAYLAEMIAAATGINLWREWAKLEASPAGATYQIPPHHLDYGGIVVSLARQENPDTSTYTDAEIKWRLQRRHHAGLVIAAPDRKRVDDLLDQYLRRFADDFFATLPEPSKPTS